MSGRARLNLTYVLYVSTQARSQVHAAVVAKRVDRHAGERVHFLEVAVRGKNNPPVGSVLALPVVEAPIVVVSFHWMRPDRFSRGGIKRNNGGALAHYIHNAVDDQWVKRKSAASP